MSLKSITQGIFLFFVFIFVLGFLIYGSQFLLDQNKTAALSSVANGVVSAENNIQKLGFPERDWRVQDLSINATSGISVESNLSDPDKTLFSKNSDTSLPIASLTKLMSAIVVLDHPISYNFTDTMTLSKNADRRDAVQNDVKAGDTLTIEEYFQIMLIESSNKAASAFAERVGEQRFVDLMNQKAKDIGLQNTSFVEPTGLSDGNVSTARDLARLAEYILKNYPKIVDTSRIEQIALPNFGTISNTNQLLGEVPQIIGGKTGFTTDAKGCLLLEINNPQANDYLIYVILGSDDRFSEMKNIINWITSAYKWQ